MNTEQITGQVRIILAALAAYVVGKGWIPEGYVADFVAIGTVVVMAVWSHLSHSLTSMISSVAASPEVKRVVVTTPSVALAVPSLKVVSA